MRETLNEKASKFRVNPLSPLSFHFSSLCAALLFFFCAAVASLPSLYHATPRPLSCPAVL